MADDLETFRQEAIRRESGGRPYIGTGEFDLSQAPLNQYGFPIWEGHAGSHAAGLYGFQPGTWAKYAAPLGIKDFSPASQDAVFRAAYMAEGEKPWRPYWTGGGGGRRTTTFDPETGRDVPRVNVTPLQQDDPIDMLLMGAALQGQQAPAPRQDDDAALLLASFIEPPGRPQAGGTGDGGAGAALELPAPPEVPQVRNPFAEAQPLQVEPGKPLPGMSVATLDTSAPQAAPFATPEGHLPPAPFTGQHPDSGIIDELLKAAKEIGTAGVGLGERAARGAALMGSGLAGAIKPSSMQGPVYEFGRGEAQVPVAPGLERLGDIGAFAMGGNLANMGAPAAAVQASPEMAQPLARAAETGRAIMADTTGAKPIPPPLQRLLGGGAQEAARVEPPSLQTGGGVAPAGGSLGLQSAVRIDGVVYTGVTHADAYEKALKAHGGVDPGSTAADRNLFVDRSGKVLTFQEARALSRAGDASTVASPEQIIQSLAEGGGREPPRGGPPKPPGPPRETGKAGPALDPPVPGEGVKQIASRVDDALHRILTSNTADKIEAMRWWRDLPRQWKDEKLRAFMADDIERRMVDPAAVLDPRTEAFLKGPGKRLVKMENELANEARQLLGPDAEFADLPSAAEGYVHRIVEQPGGNREAVLGRLDPERARAGDIVTGRGRSLSKFAPGLQARARRFVLQDEDGARVFNRETLDDKGYEYGQQVTAGDKVWTVKPPTMAEMEANTPVRYIHDYIGNLMANTLRMRRIIRNAELLRDLKVELREKGLFHEDRRMIGREGAVEKWVNLGKPPEHLSGEIMLPQMRGWTDPKIANVLNDFWRASEGSLDNFLTKANRFMIGWLFATPVPHALNVGAHWTVGRGWDWLSVPAYIRGAKSGMRAFNAVWNLTPEYTRMLREGSGLLYGDVAMENFYNTLMKKVWTEQLRDPAMWEGYAKSFGFKGVRDLVKAEYRWSRKTLWAINDMLMLQRQFELEAKGIPTRAAIRETEKDIPNYRIPSEVMGSHSFAQMLKSPNWFNFGRYKYGQINALGQVVKDMLGKSATPRERWEAAGKLTVLGTIATMGIPALNALLEGMTGNENAKVRPPGPFSLINAIRGLVQGDKEWAAAMSSFVTPAPSIAAGWEVLHNTDWMGRPTVDPRATGLGMATQAGEAAARQFYPAQLGMQMAGERGAGALGGLIGLDLPARPPGAPGKVERGLRRRAIRRENRDPIEGWIREHAPSFGAPDKERGPQGGRIINQTSIPLGQ